ncbi:hypothetical protein F9L33_00665 [Amylibacter sp. SFDW26]|uniref:YybH family protein n=1 Tax=Amylibacter sp. SFDW26 TaxID=2652722 RepID=UPI001261BE57|nr:DUF4440 domain-containing protein [Amylibacter sp. SFDW26]KAB7615314.1 hypothetical protein F9L33_00665 [Amylibacter sp. SFDW26]
MKHIAKEPHQIMECVAEYLKVGDMEGVISMFHPECKICFPRDEPAKEGHRGAREVFVDFVPMRPILTGKVTNEMINGDIAVIQADWRFEDNDGNLIAEGQSTEVVRKLENGGWGYYIDCPNGVPVL